MILKVAVTHACGCVVEHETWPFDGRSRKDRAEAVAGVERGWPAAQKCLRCESADRKRIHPIGEWWDSAAKLRFLVRAARMIGGTISRSPKSMHSLYVTGPTTAFRVSDHPWPGKPQCLVSERKHPTKYRWVARLVPNWLQIEKGLA